MARTGVDGLIGYLVWLGLHHPTAYASMLAKIIPQQIKVDTSTVIRGSFGDMEALRKEIKRRGLDLNRLLNEATKQQPSQSNK